MIKSKAIKITVITVVLGLVIFLIIFVTSPLNNLLNRTFNPIDTSCKEDADCKVVRVGCGISEPYQAVNKNWTPFCPLPVGLLEGRIQTFASMYRMYEELRCVNGNCVLLQVGACRTCTLSVGCAGQPSGTQLHTLPEACQNVCSGITITPELLRCP